jgi:alkylhydroperoxidase family enzyme
VWQAVRSDWRSAPVEPRLRATLGFLEKLTLRPGELSEADAAVVLSEGVTVDALVDAIHVAALFSMIVRLADAFGWDVPPREAHMARAGANLESGYVLLTPEDVGA